MIFTLLMLSLLIIGHSDLPHDVAEERAAILAFAYIKYGLMVDVLLAMAFLGSTL